MVDRSIGRWSIGRWSVVSSTRDECFVGALPAGKETVEAGLGMIEVALLRGQ